MAPVKIFSGGSIERETLRELIGQKGYGVIYYRAEEQKKSEQEEPLPQSFQELQNQLVEILAGQKAIGFSPTDRGQKNWLTNRIYLRDRHGEEALVNLFPEWGHPQFTRFINALARHGIGTIRQLIEQEEEIEAFRGIGKKSRKTAKLIIDYFKNKKPLIAEVQA